MAQRYPLGMLVYTHNEKGPAEVRKELEALREAFPDMIFPEPEKTGTPKASSGALPTGKRCNGCSSLA